MIVGSFSGVRRTSDEWNRAVEGYRELGPVLASHNVQLAIEPLNRFETYFLNTTVDAVALCDEVAHPNAGILWDTFHANIEEKHIGDSLLQAGPHLKHVHTCENDRGIPGSGHVEWNSVFAALRDLKYDGWLTIESFGFARIAILTKSSNDTIWNTGRLHIHHYRLSLLSHTNLQQHHRRYMHISSAWDPSTLQRQ